jgi:2'-5' RNA ligase
VRCFIGFELVDTCLERMRLRVEPFCGVLQKEFEWPVRLVPPANWHMTGLFFQDLSKEERAQVWTEVLRNVDRGSWRNLYFPWEGLALWPTPRKPNLICLAAPVAAEAQTWPLAERLETPPFTKGDTTHFREFRPHITLMRFRGPSPHPFAQDWRRIGTRIPQIPPSTIRFDRVSLFLGDTTPQKPIYTREFTASLL